MVSGHVGEDCPFWPYPRDKFPCPASFPAELFRWAGSLLSPDSDVPGSGLRRLHRQSRRNFQRLLSFKDHIQVQALTSFHSALYQMGQTRSPARSTSPLDLQPGRTVFPGSLEKR